MSEDQLRSNPTMNHLLEALENGRDIGHYGRLLFAIVGRHFLDHDTLVARLANDRDFDETGARSLVKQVTDKNYTPPNASTIRDWHDDQDFPILVEPDDPDAGNIYRDLDFPPEVYESIESYHAERAES